MHTPTHQKTVKFNLTYLDVFICKAYDTQTVQFFARQSFAKQPLGGSFSNLNLTQRY